MKSLLIIAAATASLTFIPNFSVAKTDSGRGIFFMVEAVCPIKDSFSETQDIQLPALMNGLTQETPAEDVDYLLTHSDGVTFEITMDDVDGAHTCVASFPAGLFTDEMWPGFVENAIMTTPSASTIGDAAKN